jgi:hypothetical protein
VRPVARSPTPSSALLELRIRSVRRLGVDEAAAAKRPVGSVVSAAPRDRQKFLPGVIGATAAADGLNPGATILAEARARVILSVAPGALHAEPPVNRAGPVAKNRIVTFRADHTKQMLAFDFNEHRVETYLPTPAAREGSDTFNTRQW